jgi:ketosteroid isomerase-like protein
MNHLLKLAVVLAAAGAILVIGAPAITAAREGASMSKSHEDDRREILAHIDSIFRAYIARDRAAIRRLHSGDWTGFQGPSTKIERGIDDYLVNADSSLASLQGTGYEILDSEVQVMGDLAFVYYVARYEALDNEGQAHSIPLRSIDLYRREAGGWNQFGSHISVIPPEGGWGEK